MKKQITSYLLIIAMIITMAPMIGTTAYAANSASPAIIDVSDSSGTNLPSGVTYDNSGIIGVFTVCTSGSITITGETTENAIIVANGTVVTLVLSGASITVPVDSPCSPIDLQGNADVTLQLADNTFNTMSAINTTTAYHYRAGIHAASSGSTIATLTIDGTGTLNAIGGQSGAGIGGGDHEDGGRLTIGGGTVNAKSVDFGAGIGGGGASAGGTIMINGVADVTATGGPGGAGIGGGEGGAGGDLTIGGHASVTATGGNYGGVGGTGIGGGEQGDSGTILIEGHASVTATGIGGSAGIGCGEIAACDSITIDGGTITAIGGDGLYGGAGIGGGFYSSSGAITINGGQIDATGGQYGAGIGSGYGDDGGTIIIGGGIVNATAGIYGAGIGGGATGAGGDITINGGTVNAVGSNGYGGAGIGGGGSGASGNITIIGGEVNAAGSIGGLGFIGTPGGAGIGSGSDGTGVNITISGSAIVTAVGDVNGAGIGGGRGISGGSIVIGGSTVVNATGGMYSAGIGGGGGATGGSGGEITISDVAEVTATGGTYGAGIGGGYNGTGGEINIDSSAVVISASEGNGNPAIQAVFGSGSIINAQLDNAISITDDSYLKCNGNVLKLPANYKNFAFSAAAASPINAWSDQACTSVITGIVTTPGGVVTIPVSSTIDAAPTSVTTVPAYTLTVNLNGGSGSTTSSAYASGAAVLIDAGTKSGYTFSGWTSSNGGMFSNASSAATTFTMPGNAATITAVWTEDNAGGGSGGSGNGGSGGGSKYTSADNNTVVIVDGNDYYIGSESKNGTSTMATVDQSKLTDDIVKASENSSTIFPVSANTNITAQLVVKNIEDMAKKSMTLTVQTGNVSYNLNTSAIDTAKITGSLGATDSNDIPFKVSIANSNAVVNGTSVVISPVEFTITAAYGGKTVNIEKFSSFVDRTIEITADQAKKITTAVVVEPDGSLRHVPTKVIVVDGKYYAVINSLTNSTYTVIWNPVEFTDVAAHWAKETVNDMGSRMVISGVGQGNFEPDRNITRAEFAAIIVRALGLAPGTDKSSFSDVGASEWYNGYIATASEYGIITGYDTATFGPNDNITREQAMTMIARTMKITGLKSEINESNMNSLLGNYTDGTAASDYAKTSVAVCLKNGVITGRSSDTIAPKDCITRAEVAVIVQRLLKKSDLI